LQDTDVDGNNIKIDVKETGCEGVDWIHLARDNDQWRSPVNIVTNLHVP